METSYSAELLLPDLILRQLASVLVEPPETAVMTYRTIIPFATELVGAMVEILVLDEPARCRRPSVVIVFCSMQVCQPLRLARWRLSTQSCPLFSEGDFPALKGRRSRVDTTRRCKGSWRLPFIDCQLKLETRGATVVVH